MRGSVIDPPRALRRLVRGALLAAFLTATAFGIRGLALADGEPAPPDLRLEWQDGGRGARLDGVPIHGPAGETVSIPYRLRNVGGSEAFAVILDARTALGAVGRAIRLQPGPEAGEGSDRTLQLPLARGMRELCIDARLQTLEPDLPGDPHPEDNRICRKVEIAEDEAGTVTRATSRTFEGRSRS